MLGDDALPTKFFKKTIYLNSLGSILQTVAKDQCCCMLLKSTFLNNWYVKNNIICIKPFADKTLYPNEHHLIWRDDTLLTEAEKAVVNYLKDHYAAAVQAHDNP